MSKSHCCRITTLLTDMPGAPCPTMSKGRKAFASSCTKFTLATKVILLQMKGHNPWNHRTQVQVWP